MCQERKATTNIQIALTKTKIDPVMAKYVRKTRFAYSSTPELRPSFSNGIREI